MYTCEFCKKEIQSNGEIKNGLTYHYACLEKIAQVKEKEAREARGLFYVCPNCNGAGHTLEKYSTYPNGYPDSGHVDWEKEGYVGYRKIDCKVCDREGYTSKKLKPITKVIGYE
jgi:hypothetical protein